MIRKDELIQVGYVRRPHGFKGMVQLALDAEVALQQGDFVFMELDGQLVPFELLGSIDGTEAVVGLKFVDDHDEAKRISGSSLYVDRVHLDPDAPEQRIGYMLIDRRLGELGPLLDIQSFPHQDMLIVQYQGEERMIPWVEPIVERIVDSERKILVNLPEGLLDL